MRAADPALRHKDGPCGGREARDVSGASSCDHGGPGQDRDHHPKSSCVAERGRWVWKGSALPRLKQEGERRAAQSEWGSADRQAGATPQPWRLRGAGGDGLLAPGWEGPLLGSLAPSSLWGCSRDPSVHTPLRPGVCAVLDPVRNTPGPAPRGSC